MINHETTELVLAKHDNPDVVYRGILLDTIAKAPRTPEGLIDKDAVKTRIDRTGTGTISRFGGEAKFNCRNTIPLISTKRVAIRSVIAELVWFLIGSTSADLLNKLNCTIWDEWKLENDHTVPYRLTTNERIALAESKLGLTYSRIVSICNIEDNKHEKGYPWGTNAWLDSKNIPEWNEAVMMQKGEIGPMYGKQWSHVPKGFMRNRLEILLDGMIARPAARDHLLMAWNDDTRPNYSDEFVHGLSKEEIIKQNIIAGRGAIPLCHYGYQCYNEMDEFNTPTETSLKFLMRSTDLFLGLPFNITSYGIKLHMIARHIGTTPGDLYVSFGDRHIYANHIDAVNEILTRPIDETKEVGFNLIDSDVPDILDIMRMPHDPVKLNEVIDKILGCIVGYEPQAKISAAVSV